MQRWQMTDRQMRPVSPMSMCDVTSTWRARVYDDRTSITFIIETLINTNDPVPLDWPVIRSRSAIRWNWTYTSVRSINDRVAELLKLYHSPGSRIFARLYARYRIYMYVYVYVWTSPYRYNKSGPNLLSILLSFHWLLQYTSTWIHTSLWNHE